MASRALGLLPHGLAAAIVVYQHLSLWSSTSAPIGFGIAFWDYRAQTKMKNAALLLLLEVTSKMALIFLIPIRTPPC